MKGVILFLAVYLVAAAQAAPASRTVMIQLFSWPWTAVAEECERELGPAGFSAVQVSPPQEHVVVANAPWWERYQPVSYKLHSRSGTEAEFAEMVRRCKRAGVDIYADVVLNHMNAMPAGRGFAGTSFSHYAYEGSWSHDDFHHCGRNGDNGLRDFTDLYELQNCELLGMADLDTGHPIVQGRLAAYLNRLLDLGVAGFRVDAAKHISASDLLAIFRQVPRPHYRVLELILTPGEPVRLADYLPAGDINDFAYSYGVGDAFTNGDFSRLPTLPGASGIRSEDSVVFLENHDLERRPARENILAYVKDPALNRLGSVFLLTWPYGYPQVYSGYGFSDNDAGAPLNEKGFISGPGPGSECRAPFTCMHRAPWLKRLVQFRNATDRFFRATNVRAEGAWISYGRGEAGHVVISGEKGARDFAVQTSMRPGRYCNLASDEEDSDCAQVDAKGVLRVTLAPRSAFVIQDAGRRGRK